MYLTVEEKNRLDDQLNSMQSAVFTSDHQLRSIQVNIIFALLTLLLNSAVLITILIRLVRQFWMRIESCLRRHVVSDVTVS